ncbi:MAG: shikimate dehydrogenase [Phascolarctobacterium sp.]|nr:shikimate dehydrogenase [Phascolarctobacterium sp.]
MDKFGLIGGKLGHSLSPAIHDLFFKYVGKVGSYELLETELDEIPARMQALRNGFKGVNVTIPHKLHVMPLLDGITDEAKAIGAVNTIKFTSDGAFGFNTDYFGFGRMLEYNEIFVKDQVCVVLGSGGAARAVVKYLADAGATKLFLVTRDISKCDPHFQEIAPGLEVITYKELENLQGYCLVNCTPVGMFPKVAASPVPKSVNARFEASVDAIYNPSETLFLAQAKACGKKAVNGLFMLVAQAVAAQEIWQDEKYDSELIVKIMHDLEQKI